MHQSSAKGFPEVYKFIVALLNALFGSFNL